MWKNEELVDAYDANGNLVKRPKNKIPVKSKQNENNPYEEKISDQAKSSTLNYAQDGINYGALFNWNLIWYYFMYMAFIYFIYIFHFYDSNIFMIRLLLLKSNISF